MKKQFIWKEYDMLKNTMQVKHMNMMMQAIPNIIIYMLTDSLWRYLSQGEEDIIPYAIHTDHLGSMDIIADRNGTIVDSMSFDA